MRFVSWHILFESSIVQLRENWYTRYFRIWNLKAYTVYKSKGNSNINHTMKGYVLVSDSRFLDSLVRDDENVSNSVEKVQFFIDIQKLLSNE